MGHHHGHGHDHDHESYYDHTKLYDNQYIFLQHYVEMLRTCEEGMKYISIKIQQEKSNDENMIRDCFQALHAIQDANQLAGGLLKQIDEKAYGIISSYDDFTGNLKNEIQFQQIEDFESTTKKLINEFAPEFFNWAEKVKAELEKHIKED